MGYRLTFTRGGHMQQKRAIVTTDNEAQTINAIRNYIWDGWTLIQLVPTDGYDITEG